MTKNTVVFLFLVSLFLLFYAVGFDFLVDVFPVERDLKNEVILEEVNKHRMVKDIPSLILDDSLSAAAEEKLKDMFLKEYFDHISPEGEDISLAVKRKEYEFITVGENLIQGVFKDEKDVVDMWMDSPGHRENIVGRQYKETGIASGYGELFGRNVFVSVQIFATPLSVCPEVDDLLPERINEKEKKIENLRLKIDIEERMDTYNALVREHNNLVSEISLLIEEYNEMIREQEECFLKYR